MGRARTDTNLDISDDGFAILFRGDLATFLCDWPLLATAALKQGKFWVSLAFPGVLVPGLAILLLRKHAVMSRHAGFAGQRSVHGNCGLAGELLELAGSCLVGGLSCDDSSVLDAVQADEASFLACVCFTACLALRHVGKLVSMQVNFTCSDHTPKQYIAPSESPSPYSGGVQCPPCPLREAAPFNVMTSSGGPIWGVLALQFQVKGGVRVLAFLYTRAYLFRCLLLLSFR